MTPPDCGSVCLNAVRGFARTMSDDDAGQATAQLFPYAPGLVFVGVWGLILAVLNMIGRIHPTYHVLGRFVHV